MDYVTLDVSQDGPESFVNKVGFSNHTYLLCFTVFIFDHFMGFLLLRLFLLTPFSLLIKISDITTSRFVFCDVSSKANQKRVDEAKMARLCFVSVRMHQNTRRCNKIWLLGSLRCYLVVLRLFWITLLLSIQCYLYFAFSKCIMLEDHFVVSNITMCVSSDPLLFLNFSCSFVIIDFIYRINMTLFCFLTLDVFATCTKQ